MADMMSGMLNKNDIIAIVGASNNPNKYGYKIYMDLKNSGYKVIPINPKEKFIDGDICYKSILDFDGKINTLDMIVPAHIGMNILDEAKKLGIKNVWFQPGSESDEVISKAKDFGMSVISRACMMVEKN